MRLSFVLHEPPDEPEEDDVATLASSLTTDVDAEDDADGTTTRTRDARDFHAALGARLD